MEFSFTSKYLYPTLLGDMDHWKPFFTTLNKATGLRNQALSMDVNYSMVSIAMAIPTKASKSFFQFEEFEESVHRFAI